MENPPSVTGRALARVVYDAIVSIKSFGIATPPVRKFISLLNVLFFESFIRFETSHIDSAQSSRSPGCSSETLVFRLSAVWRTQLPWYSKEILRVLFSAKMALIACFARHAAARWGVVQLVGHLTVNEDGEGSNPSAPANFSALQSFSTGNPASVQPRHPPSMDSTFV